jgi:HEAT repeat protein
MKDPSFVSTLLPYARDPNSAVRAEVIRSLGLISGPSDGRVLEALRRATEDTDNTVFSVAYDILSVSTDPNAKSVLERNEVRMRLKSMKSAR